MNKIIKVSSILLILILLLSSLSINSLASYNVVGNVPNSNREYEDSVGSSASDYKNNNTPSGKDNTQDVESAFKYILTNENNSSANNINESANVYLTKAPIYSVKIPKTIILSSSGIGEYDIGIKGDIASSQKLTIKPIDAILDTSDIDFYMSEQYTTLDSKNDLVAVIDQTKTAWTYSEINKDNFSYLSSAGKINASNVSAGSWAGTFNFDMRMDIMEVSDTQYFKLCAPGVYPLQEISKQIKSGVETLAEQESISYYAASVIGILEIYNTDSIAAAKTSDEALNEYVDTNVLESIKENNPKCQNATNINEALYMLRGYTFYDIERCIRTGEVPEGYDAFKDYTGLFYLTIADEYNCNTTNRKLLPSNLVLPTELYGYKIDAIANFAFSGYDEIEYIYVPSTYNTFDCKQFLGCKAKEIIIRNQNLTDFSSEYFSNNTSIEILSLPSNITEIPSGAFEGCTNLKIVYYGDNKELTF